MLELYGSGYVIEHCISAFRKSQEEKAYRIYVTDALYYLGGLNMRFADIIKPQVHETRSANEIIDNLKAKLSKEGGK